MVSKRAHQLTWGIMTAAFTVVLGLIDWRTGYELQFFVFYFLPVAVAARYLGLAGSISFGIFSAVVWFGADVLSGHTYPSSVFAVWNTLIRLISFLAIGVSVAKLKQTLDRERETSDSLRRSLSAIKVLEAFLPICAQCKKIRNQQGDWQQLETYIGQHTDTQFSHGYCPECLKRAMAEAGLAEDKTRPGR